MSAPLVPTDGVLYVKELRRVQLQPGDVLVVKARGRLSKREIDYMKHLLAHYFPAHQALILTDGIDLGVIAAGEAKA
jgi:hypothetical protein